MVGQQKQSGRHFDAKYECSDAKSVKVRYINVFIFL